MFFISIHALQAESDSFVNVFRFIKLKFQSTLSKRRATRVKNILFLLEMVFQSTLSKRRATKMIMSTSDKSMISIHALQAESDSNQSNECYYHCLFQSTLSKRRATSAICFSNCSLVYFNPRSPSGERLNQIIIILRFRNFNPRSPSGERRDSHLFQCIR